MGASTTLKGANYTKTAIIVAGTITTDRSFPDASQRKLRVMYDSWESATSYDDPSTISFGLLPKGCRVLGWMVSWEAQGAAVTADFEIGGVTASADEAVTDMTSLGQLFVPALAVFQQTPLTEDSILTFITKDQAMGQNLIITVATLYLDED